MKKLLKLFRRHTKVHVKRLKRVHKHPFIIPALVFVGLLFVSAITWFIIAHQHRAPTPSNSFIVIVSHDHERQTVPTKAGTVGEFLKKVGITLDKGDRVEPSVDSQILQDNFLVNVYRAVPVSVQDSAGGQPIRGLSAATTPRSIAQEAGLTIFPEDTIKTTDPGNLTEGAGISKAISIDRSIPINLNIYGTPTVVRTHAKTVAELVKEKHIKLVQGATLTPAGNTPLAANEQVFILSKGVSITSVEETIAMPVQTMDDNNLTLGAKAVRQVGSEGKQLVTYQITVDPATGKEVSRTVLQTVVTQTPVTQIVAIGKHVDVPQDKVTIMQAVGIAPSDYGYVDYIVSHEGGWGGVTKYNSAGSGAYGICQALPGSKMASAGADWATNAVTQLRWCNGYAVGRYGSWGGAYNYWLSHNYW